MKKIGLMIACILLCVMACTEQLVVVSISSFGNGSVSFDESAGLMKEIVPGTRITIRATPAEGYEFKGWFVGNSETPESVNATYSFVVSKDVALVAKFEKQKYRVSVEAFGEGRVVITNNGLESGEFPFGASIGVEARPADGYEFKGWFIGDSETPVSTYNVYNFTIKEDVVLVAKFINTVAEDETVEVDLNPSGSIGGYDYVDLGLSVKWATYNVGANSLEEIGEYYAWGEATPYNQWTYDNYSWTHFPCSPDRVLASIYDAATINWGRQWRMPTYDEQKELINGCDWYWVDDTNYDFSIAGYVGVSKVNGKSIFLPASKFVSHNAYEIPKETDGIYWSSTSTGVPGKLGLQAGSTADCIVFDNPSMNNPVAWGIWCMGKGATIRAVVGAPNDYFPDPSTNIIDEVETIRQGYTVNGSVDGHTYVDMGLPSRTLWATYNVGAEMPGEYGDHFAWGETSPKGVYSDETYIFFNGYLDSDISYPQYTKYVCNKKYGKIDGKSVLDSTDDAATVNWGENWCMPTQEQYVELDKYCRVWRKDIEVNGKKIIGCVVESYINGNRIYIPAAGWEYKQVPNNHMWVWYWTSELSMETNARAKQMIFLEDEKRLDCAQDAGRVNGLSVRAVVKKR